MDTEQEKGIEFKKFTWIIRDFSKTKTKKLRSQSFEVGGCKWRILVNPIAKSVEHLSLFLKVVNPSPSYGWAKYASFKLSLINQMDSEKSITKETQQKFNAGYTSWGASFMLLTDFYNTTKGYLLNNACIIEAQVSISNDAFKIQDKSTNQEKTEEPTQLEDKKSIDNSSDGTPASFKSYDESIWNQEPSNGTPSPKHAHYEPTAPPLYPLIDDDPVELEVPLSPLCDLIDFRSLKPEELGFMLLLEDVCARYPSLIESQRKRTPKFIHWAFMALGQVLYFLETMKVKDMDESNCKHLQSLWEEVQLFGFDLSWLEPHVEYALGMKNYLERAEKARKLKEEIAALDTEMKKLRSNLAIVEVDLNIERRHLAQEEKGFQEVDMDAQLGYGIF